jgi:uncharacterized protein YlxW (UPF0749 family)
MAPWLPAVKIVLPYLAQMVGAAIPAFTQKPDKSGSDELTRRQITELQDAVTHNAASIKALAEQMQQVVQGLDAATARAEQDMRAARRLAIAALALSIAAAGVALYAIAR